MRNNDNEAVVITNRIPEQNDTSGVWKETYDNTSVILFHRRKEGHEPKPLNRTTTTNMYVSPI